MTERERQEKYVIQTYSGGAACFACGKIQTPWEAAGQTAEAWIKTGDRVYHCVECGAQMRHDVLLMGGWRWGNPNLKVHR